jgi:hypothetical protein
MLLETDLQPILSGLNERKLKNKVIYVEEGIPQTLTSVSKLSRKRTQSTVSIDCLNHLYFLPLFFFFFLRLLISFFFRGW